MTHRRRHAPLPQSRRRLVAALEQWTVFRLDRAAAALRERVEDVLVPRGLNLVTFAALSVVAHHGPISPSSLAERIGVDRTSMSHILDDLHHDGCVKRRPHPVDGRRYVASLTTAGVRLLDEAAAAIKCAEEAFLEILDDYEREDLRHTLRRLEPPEHAVGDLYFLGPRRE